MTGHEPTTDPRSDEALVDAINAGNTAAFDAIYMRYRDWVVSLAWRISSDRDVALDVLQDTFLYLLRKFPGFVLRARMKTVLYPVVRHLAIAAASKARCRLPNDAEPAAHDPIADDDARRLLAHAVAALPAGQREVLYLRFADDLPLNEIAEALELPLGTVKSRLHNALETLRGDDRTRKYFEP